MDDTGQGPDVTSTLKAPFPWFGGKSRAAPLIWERLGNVPNYVEPFAGSLAVLFGRPSPPRIETINDKDGFVANVWRSIQADPEGTAAHADWPSNECDLHARHLWLKARREALSARLMADPGYYDVQIAGWWLWGIAQWIGGGWCGEGVPILQKGEGVQGVSRQRLHLGDAGNGVSRKAKRETIQAWFLALQARLRHVRVCCGEWDRVMGPSATAHHGMTGVVLDPPYSAAEDRDMTLYAEESHDVAHAVRAWCLAHGANPLLRIVLCGYGDVHDALLAQGWRQVAWRANGGMGNRSDGRGRENKYRERLWCSPACLDERQGSLFSQ